VSRIEEFEKLRSLLFSIAYRILGSASQAQGAVEETWLRYETAPTAPASAKALLSAEVTRISTDVLRSARMRQDTCAGPWLPEPLLSDLFQEPERPAELTGLLSMAAVLLLERLSPLERAVFVLQEIFGCDVPRIASAVGCSEAACHQLATSVTALSDAGGTALTWPGHVVGADHVARVLAAIVPALVRVGVTMRPQDVDSGPGAVFRDRNGTVLGALALDILDGRIQTLRWMPDFKGLGGEGEAA
jgi:RNA polymerase sigma-70 factor, ECF subfamily